MTISEIPGQNEIFRGDIELSRERGSVIVPLEIILHLTFAP